MTWGNQPVSPPRPGFRPTSSPLPALRCAPHEEPSIIDDREKASRGPGRVAALDLGERRIGVAVCDELGMTVRPLGVIARLGPRRDAQSLRKLLEGLGVRLLVAGIPLLDSGEEGESARARRAQGEDLARRVRLPLELVDESDTTLEAKRMARDGRVDAATPVDAVAAALILEEWLAARSRGARPT